jgi:cytidylate kinase
MGEAVMPLIAMTREMGSLGKDVAARLSERLGKRVVHHEIIDQLASKMRLRKSHVIRFLEGKAGIWERLTTDQTSLSIYTADETFQLAESGQVAVIRGWGAAHLLRPIPHVVCIRVCAPLELRTRRMMERLKTDDRALVESEIRLNEEAHGAITRRHFSVNWQDAENYDLVLNTERLAIDECVEQVMNLLDDRTFQETPASIQMFSNLALRTHVRAALRQDPRTAKMVIAIEADEGRITLSGMLETGLEAKDAVEVAATVPGVKDVVNRLRTASASSPYHIDT